MSQKQIATSTLWQVASQVAMAALSIITVKLIAVGLTKELAGAYNTAYGFLQIFGILADFGLYAVAVREVSKVSGKEREKMLGVLLTLRSIILCLSLGTALIIAWVIPAWTGTVLPLGITIAVFVPFFTLLAGILRTIFQVNYKMHFVFVAEVSQRLLTVTLTGIIVAMGLNQTADPFYYYLFLLFGGVGSLLLFLFSIIFGSRFMTIRPRWDSELLKRSFVQALPYGLAFLCTALYRQSDVTLIATLRSDFALQNAYYGFVQRAMDMAYLFPTFLLNSTLPILSERSEKGEDTREILGKTFHIILLLGTTLFLFAYFWSRPLMQLLTTDRYLSTIDHPGSDTALHLLAFSMFFNGILLFAFYSLLTKHNWKPLVMTLFIGAIVSISLNLYLIPTYGFVGACITSIVTHVTLATLLLPQSFRTLPFTYSLRSLLQWLIYTAILAAGLWVATPLLTSSVLTAIGIVVAGGYILVIAWGTGIAKSLRG
jgi:O-antigen/teichoic acid export membrane protein